MRIILFVLALGAFLMGGYVMLLAQTMLHIQALMFWLIGSVFYAGLGIIEEIYFTKSEIISLRQSIDNVTILPDDE